MNKKNRSLLSEAKRDLTLAIVKSLSQSPLSPMELDEVLAVTEADLLRDHELDLFMAQQVKWHAKHEQYRLRAQNLYTPQDSTENLYPDKPYTRTNPINENTNFLGTKKTHLTKRQLRRIIKEEKKNILNEMEGVDRAIGLYFDVNQQKMTFDSLTVLLDESVADAIEDGYEEDEARDVVLLAIQKLFNEWINSMRGGSGWYN